MIGVSHLTFSHHLTHVHHGNASKELAGDGTRGDVLCVRVVIDSCLSAQEGAAKKKSLLCDSLVLSPPPSVLLPQLCQTCVLSPSQTSIGGQTCVASVCRSSINTQTFKVL